MIWNRFTSILGAIGMAIVLGACAESATHRSTGQVVDDATITARVKTAFAKDETVSAMSIDVDTYKGAVHLNGTVKSHEEAQRAVQLAQAVDGVTQVSNNLEIRP